MLDEMCTQQHFEYIESLTGHEQKNIVPSFTNLVNLAKYYQPSQTMSVDKHEYHYTGTIS